MEGIGCIIDISMKVIDFDALEISLADAGSIGDKTCLIGVKGDKTDINFFSCHGSTNINIKFKTILSESILINSNGN